MNPKNYTSLTTSKRLKELGIFQKSDMSWFGDETEFNEYKTKVIQHVWIARTAPVNNQDADHREDIGHTEPIASAFNASELIAMISFNLFSFSQDNQNYAEFIAMNIIDGIEQCALSVESINERYTKYISNGN